MGHIGRNTKLRESLQMAYEGTNEQGRKVLAINIPSICTADAVSGCLKHAIMVTVNPIL